MKIKICTWNKCLDKFSEYIVKRIKNDKNRFNLNTVEIEEVSCMWNCDNAPVIIIDNEKIEKINPLKASEILNKKLKEQKWK